MSKAEEYFKKEWGTGFIKSMLSEKNGLLEMSMEDIYNTMQSFADEQNELEVDTILKLKVKLKVVEEQNKALINKFKEALKNVSEYLPEDIAFQIIHSLNQQANDR